MKPLKSALSQKLADGELIIVDSLKVDSFKTAQMQTRLSKLGLDSVLFIDGVLDPNFARSVSNLVNVDLLPQEGANVYSILRRKMLVLSQDAVHHLEARLK